MYSFDTRVRYSECNYKGEATLASILDYLQDCCTFQSEDLGIGVEYLKDINRAWLLSSWQVDIIRYPVMGESIIIKTIPYEIKGIYGLRNFIIETARGEEIVKANSIWVYVDTVTGRPAKPDDDIKCKYPMEEKIDMEYLGRKLPKFSGGEAKEKKVVPHYFIDTNHHVNNSKYILFGEEYLPGDYTVHRIWAEYKNAAVLGDNIQALVADNEKGIYVSVTDGEGNVFANIIFE